MHFGKFLFTHNIKNVVADGVKKVGRNRISVQFKSASDANSFIDHPALLNNNYLASIPSFNVSRMGIIRNVPVEWSMEELVQNVRVPDGHGKVFRARRLNRKENVSYMEASARFAPVRKSYADSSRLPSNSQIHPSSSVPRLPTVPIAYSYKKIISVPRHSPSPASSHGYDRQTQNSLTHTPTSTQPNGCALTNTSLVTEPNDNLIEMLFLQLSTLINFIKRFEDIELPNNLKQKLTELSFLVILAIQETWLRPGTRFWIPGYACLRDDRNDGKGGSVLFVLRNYSFHPINLSSHNTEKFNIIAIRAMNISFISIYIPNPDLSILLQVFSIIKSIEKPYIILGDFNIHNEVWGCHISDSLSSTFLDLLDDLNLCILNDGSPTRRVAPNQNPKSAVDLSICSASLASNLNWQILTNTYGSDHYPILVFLPAPSKEAPHITPRQKHILAPADWNKYSSRLDDKMKLLPSLQAPDNNDNHYSLFKNTMLSVADESCKLPPKNDDNTPVKSMFNSPPPHAPLPSAAGNLDEYFRNMESSLLSKLKTELVSLIEEKILKDIQKKVGAIPQVKTHLDEITQSLSLLSDKYDSIIAENQQSREKISRLEKTVVNINNKCVYLEKCNVALEQKIHEFEQASLNNCIEIVGIEKLTGENLEQLITKVADTINVSTSEIEWARRTTTPRPLKTSAKPAPIVVKFKASGADSRDTWLVQRRKLMEVTSDKITGGSATNKIYINEALTKLKKVKVKNQYAFVMKVKLWPYLTKTEVFFNNYLITAFLDSMLMYTLVVGEEVEECWFTLARGCARGLIRNLSL
ncbi:hypothetical protein evm_015183 [Chilo suppressalis]|nr:hypothetical protein evm_015183 [Chilo suppressalis]